MTITWTCFHCQTAIALVSDGRVNPTAGCQAVWATEAVGVTPLYCCLHCGALQMVPHFATEVEKASATVSPEGDRVPAGELAAREHEDSRRYQILKRLFSENRPILVIQLVLGRAGLEVTIASERKMLAGGVNLDNALDRAEKQPGRTRGM